MIILRRLLKYLFGSVNLSLGIALSIYSDIGAGAFDAMNFALANLLNISVGSAMYIAIFSLFAFTMILKPDKKYVVGFLLTLITGFLVDRWLSVLPLPDHFYLQVVYFVLALFFLPYGIAFMIRSKMPLSPMDTLMLILVDKFNQSISKMKTTLEGTFVVLALLFGFLGKIGTGSISIGTIIITFSIGPLIQLAMRYIKESK